MKIFFKNSEDIKKNHLFKDSSILEKQEEIDFIKTSLFEKKVKKHKKNISRKKRWI